MPALHEVVVIGAGPVGATHALALGSGEIDVVAVDSRPAQTSLRGDRSLALSHAARLIFERFGKTWGTYSVSLNGPICRYSVLQ